MKSRPARVLERLIKVTTPPSVTSRLILLRKIDQRGMTVRDVIVLWAIMKRPGSMGQELSNRLGYNSRSSVQTNIERLIRFGLIEDRRLEQKAKCPNQLYMTDKGREFWQEVME